MSCSCSQLSSALSQQRSCLTISSNTQPSWTQSGAIHTEGVQRHISPGLSGQDLTFSSPVTSTVLTHILQLQSLSLWQSSTLGALSAQMASASSMHEAGHSKLVLWDNPEGWGGEGSGGWSGWRGHMYTCGQFMLMYGKNHHNIVIIFYLNKYKKSIRS